MCYNWATNGTRIVLHMKHDGMSPHKWKTIISNCLRNVQTFSFWVCFVLPLVFASIFFPLHNFRFLSLFLLFLLSQRMRASWPWTVHDTLEKVTLSCVQNEKKTQQPSTNSDWMYARRCQIVSANKRNEHWEKWMRKMRINMYTCRVNLVVIVKYSCHCYSSG